jgi:hypothetical protein
LAVLEHWLEHGDLSIDPKKVKAQHRNRHTQQRERSERDSPWVVTVMLSSAVMPTGKTLGKAVGQEALPFQREEGRATGDIVAHAPTDAGVALGQARQRSERRRIEQIEFGESAAEVMQPQAKRSTAWGQQPAVGWTEAQTKAWEKEQQASKKKSEDMDERVQSESGPGVQEGPGYSVQEDGGGHQESGRAAEQKTGSEAVGTGGGIPHGE